MDTALFIFVCVISVIALFLFIGIIIYYALRSRRLPIVSGAEFAIGKKGILEKNGRTMWVRIEGERWQCHSHEPLETGTIVRVKRVKGLILEVIKEK